MILKPNRKLVLAIDFDGTIVTDAYPNIGQLLPNAKQCINDLYEKHNCEIVIWTCRTGVEEFNCRNFLIENNMHFTTINQNTPAVICRWNKDDSRKVYADIYIDDRSQYANKQISWLNIYNFVLDYKYKLYPNKFI